MPLSGGSRLGPYEIVSLLGAGGMGEVYKACDTHLERTVAVKALGGQLVGRVEPDHRILDSLRKEFLYYGILLRRRPAHK